MEDINKIVQDAVVAALKSAAGAPVEGGVVAAPASKTLTTRGFTNEPKEALKHYLRTGDTVAAKAVLEEGTNNVGGYLVPVDLYNQIIARRDEASILGSFNFTRITTQSKNIVVPAQSTKGSFGIVAESGSANESEPDFANSRTITNYKYSMLIKASNEFLSDQQANFDQFLQNEIGRAYAQAVNNAVLAGTGSSQPYGILARASNSVTAAAATSFTFANVISMQTSINPAYMTGGKDVGFAMTAKTYGLVRGLTGNYPQFRPINGTTTNSMGWEIDGIPVFPTVYVPEVATGVKSMVYGNFGYYAFVENGQLEIKRNEQLYMANDQVGFFCYTRFGGDVLQPEAFSYLLQP